MFENIKKFFKKASKKETQTANSRDTAKERLHLVLMQDRANVSADFLDLMRQEIIEVIKKYIDIDESALDVRLKNQQKEDGTQGAPVLYANIPILNIKDENKKNKKEEEEKSQENKTEIEQKKEVNEIENKTEEEKENKEDNREDKNEQKNDENNNEAELEKQEEEKIEEAKKIVEEENSDTNNSETKQEEDKKEV